MEKTNLKKLIYSALFLALGIVLPLFTAQIKEIGDTLLPMHLPVMLCGIFCGWYYGLAVGLMLPFMRSAIFSMPPLYPNAVYMALELAAYGFVLGLLYSKRKTQKIWYLYFSLITSMVLGRVVWGIAKAVLLGLAGKTFTISAFVMGGFVDSLLGIALQLVLIPLIVKITEKIKAER